MNQKKWEALSVKSRAILTSAVAEHEESSLKARAELAAKEKVELEKRGIKTVDQSPEASVAFVEAAVAENLNRMRERMTKAGGTGGYDELVGKFIVNK